jgi:hypothetical protein
MTENVVPRAPGPHPVPADGAWHTTLDEPTIGTIIETTCGRTLGARPTLTALTWPTCARCSNGCRAPHAC